MAFSHISEVLESNRRSIATEANHVLDLIHVIKSGELQDFESTEEIIEAMETSVRIILTSTVT